MQSLTRRPQKLYDRICQFPAMGAVRPGTRLTVIGIRDRDGTHVLESRCFIDRSAKNYFPGTNSMVYFGLILPQHSHLPVDQSRQGFESRFFMVRHDGVFTVECARANIGFQLVEFALDLLQKSFKRIRLWRIVDCVLSTDG
jgi:hypothetical protein